MKTLFSFSLIFVFYLFTITTAKAQVDVNDSLALVDLYNSTNGPGWYDHDGWLTSPVENWKGISLTSDGKRIKSIQLPANNLWGNMTSSLDKLLYLENLDLQDNKLSGDIPFEVGNILSLKNLNLRRNHLSGSIPSTIGNILNLASLYLDHNRFTFNGMELIAQKFPFASYSKQALIPLHLNDTTLSVSAGGTLANNIYKWFRKDAPGYIIITGDSVFHPIESGIYAVKVSNKIASKLNLSSDTIRYGRAVTQINIQDSLALVDLYNSTNGAEWYNHTNWLTGRLKDWYGISFNRQKRVTAIQLSNNNLTGFIPSSLGSIANLERLYLSNNNLNSSIPSSLGNLSNLKYLLLDNNQLSGFIPPALGKLLNLYELRLYDNQLTGSIPPELNRPTILDLHDNKLSGNIPPDLANLSAVGHLNLSHNQLNGHIPSELGNLPYLSYLDLSYNQLNGNIPPELGNLSFIISLNVSNNQLSGPIPPELGNLSLDYYGSSLDLSYNQLSGNIPPELGKLDGSFMYYPGKINLSNNQLNGPIPPELGIHFINYLNLSHNQLSGPIPPELGYLSNDQGGLNLSYNQLNGSIPPELSRLSCYDCSLDLSHNQLNGSIPWPGFGFAYVRLSYNHLEGSIPADIGDSRDLLYLFLDHNKLSGSVPAGIANLYLDSLDLSHNKFTFDGMELVAQTFPSAKYNRQAPIPIHLNNNGLSVSAGGTLSNNIYQWHQQGKPGNTTIKGDSVFRPTESGVYFVEVRNKVVKSLNLVSKPIKYTAPLNAIASNEQQEFLNNSFSVYPNPAKNVLHVSGNSNASFSLVSEDGKTLLISNTDKTGVVNISHVAAGVYYLKDNNTNTSKKIAVIK